MRLCKILFVLSFFCSAFFSVAQVYNFKNYSLDEGLSRSQVQCIEQDGDGFLWIATAGGGLNRFDGKSFKVYKKEQGLNTNEINVLLYDSKGYLWIGTSEGLNRFNNGKIEKFNGYEGIRDDQIVRLCEDKSGRIWIGTKQSGVIVYTQGKFEKYSINDGLGFSNVSSLYEDRQGRMWIGSHGYGIAFHENGKVTNITAKAELNGTVVYDISEDLNGNILVFTESGVFSFLNGVFVPSEVRVTGFGITRVIKDRYKNFWISTAGRGVLRISPNNKFTLYSEDNGLPTDYITTVFEDNSGNLWLGTDGSGICRFGGEAFVHFNKYSGLPSNLVKDVIEDVAGRVWVATEKGIGYIDGSSFRIFTRADGLSSDNALSLYEDAAGGIWVGTDRGACRMYDGKINGFADSIDFPVLCFFQDKKRTLWVGTSKGVFTWDGNRFLPFHADVFSSVHINHIGADRNGKIVICSARGYSFSENEQLTHYKITDRFGSKEVVSFYHDIHGNYWFLTANSLSVLRADNTYDHYTMQEGLSSDNLYSMLHDGKNFWIGTDNGVDKIILNENHDIDSVRHFGRNDGFTGIECNQNASFAGESGNLWFGTIKGLTRYKATDYPLNTAPPFVKLTGIRLLYQPVDWRKSYPGTEDYYLVPKNLSVNYYDNHLTFDFIAFDYKNPEEVKYQFFLEGFDQSWSPETFENSATYSNLPPGDYTFKVRARNSDGYWSNSVSYSFYIAAPFWKSKWFFLVLAGLIVIFVYGFIVVRTRRLRLAKRKLEEKVRVRTLELNTQKEELQKLSIVASHMHDGVLICDSTGNIEWFNDAFYRLSGYSKGEFENTYYGKCKTLQELSSRPEMPEFMARLKNDPSPIVYDSTHQHKNGTAIWTRGSLAPIYGEKGLEKIVAIYTDITDQKNIEHALEQSNKDFLDSVKYAKRIQEAILPLHQRLKSHYPDSFIVHMPRDIVSGDFFWYEKINETFVFAVADCTGHGVPGAFMSMIGNEFLRQIARNKNVTRCEQVLFMLDRMIARALHQEGEVHEAKDGMDIGLCAINTETLECQFAGASISLFTVQNGNVTERDALKESIGGYTGENKQFFSHSFRLSKGDTLYMTTDGYTDQFGGSSGKKFMKKNFVSMLAKIHTLPLTEQKIELENEFYKWKDKRKQVDDVLIAGIRI